MVSEALSAPGAVDSDPARDATSQAQNDLLEWLRSGRLTLVDRSRNPVESERWPELPAEVRARALEDFRRVVRGGTKAAIIFLHD